MGRRGGEGSDERSEAMLQCSHSAAGGGSHHVAGWGPGGHTQPPHTAGGGGAH